ncbi:alba 1 [Cardiosporidium cionae]|uniref:Alba 1 n=1 Tax=Cardiosporidium cionae TaxID=476202 RepID=A0ABQ7J8A0_9APIC|nr:alba 1 [Cardiosporidium cionae]|eukprot:KAF8820223.1 alba 1 [Cardiosporidium cionae]
MQNQETAVSMEKYRKVPRVKEPIQPDEIRIMSDGRIANYLNYAIRLFEEQKRTSLTIKATGNAIGRAISLAETIKRKFKGIHQITKCDWTVIMDVFEPIEEGLNEIKHERTVSFLEIKLSKEKLDENDPGYQSPLDESLVTEFTEEEIEQSKNGTLYRGRGRGRGNSGRGSRGSGFHSRRWKGNKPQFDGHPPVESNGNWQNDAPRGGRGSFRGRRREGSRSGGRGGRPGGHGNFVSNHESAPVQQ